MTNRILLLLLSSLCLVACDYKTTPYSHYEPVNPIGWHQDSVLTFDYEIADTVSLYDLIINVRYNDAYPYQNMWLFVGGDTIEFFLMDERGQWLGNGRNGRVNMPVLYETGYRFEHSGPQSLTVAHAMRDSLLRGVLDVGLEVKKSSK